MNNKIYIFVFMMIVFTSYVIAEPVVITECQELSSDTTYILENTLTYNQMNCFYMFYNVSNMVFDCQDNTIIYEGTLTHTSGNSLFALGFTNEEKPTHNNLTFKNCNLLDVQKGFTTVLSYADINDIVIENFNVHMTRSTNTFKLRFIEFSIYTNINNFILRDSSFYVNNFTNGETTFACTQANCTNILFENLYIENNSMITFGSAPISGFSSNININNIKAINTRTGFSSFSNTDNLTFRNIELTTYEGAPSSFAMSNSNNTCMINVSNNYGLTNSSLIPNGYILRESDNDIDYTCWINNTGWFPRYNHTINVTSKVPLVYYGGLSQGFEYDGTPNSELTYFRNIYIIPPIVITGSVVDNTINGISNMIVAMIIIAIIIILASIFANTLGIIEKDFMIKILLVSLIGVVLIILVLAFNMFKII